MDTVLTEGKGDSEVSPGFWAKDGGRLRSTVTGQADVGGTKACPWQFPGRGYWVLLRRSLPCMAVL